MSYKLFCVFGLEYSVPTCLRSDNGESNCFLFYLSSIKDLIDVMRLGPLDNLGISPLKCFFIASNIPFIMSFDSSS